LEECITNYWNLYRGLGTIVTRFTHHIVPMLEKIGPSLRRNGGNVIIVSTLFTVFTTIAVALRLLSNRFITKIKFGWSERLLVIAQIVWYAQYAVQFHGTLPYSYAYVIPR